MIAKVSRRAVISGLACCAAFGTAGASERSAHDFAFAGIDGETFRLADWAGRPVLVVNTASRCGFTYQYDGLQALYDAHKTRGLVVLGVPSDDFGGQELETEAKVKEFCAVNFAIDFPMTEITRVKGRTAHPFYVWAARTGGAQATPTWNFHKILIGPKGNLIAGFPSGLKPRSRQIVERIQPFLTPQDKAS